MDFMQFVDIILHVDKSLGFFDQGIWQPDLHGPVLDSFRETGLVVPFLPGDTLLFIGGAFCASGEMNICADGVVVVATTGNTLNYWIGSLIGHKVYTHDYRWLDKKALQNPRVL